MAQGQAAGGVTRHQLTCCIIYSLVTHSVYSAERDRASHRESRKGAQCVNAVLRVQVRVCCAALATAATLLISPGAADPAQAITTEQLLFLEVRDQPHVCTRSTCITAQ